MKLDEQDEVLSYMRHVIDQEAAALNQTAGQISNGHFEAIKILMECRGKITITGMGKSGLIGRKIAATMSSTGTPAIFLHPAEAMHGDLGIVAGNDVVIAIGKSGESDELNSILPVVRDRIGCKVIAITANPSSTLGKSADVVLMAHVDREACPLDLAPTSSAIAALAVGDALAMTLMKLKNFKPENFALYHPGGKLGRRLLLKAGDLMIPKSDCAILSLTNASIEDVINSLSSAGHGIVLFSENGKQLDGIATDGDIRRLLEKHHANAFKLKLTEWVNRNPQTVDVGMQAVEVLAFMERGRAKPLNVVVVIDGENISGVVRLHELLRVS